MTWKEHFEWKGERRRKRHYGLAIEKRMVKRGSTRARAVAAVEKTLQRRAQRQSKPDASPVS